MIESKFSRVDVGSDILNCLSSEVERLDPLKICIVTNKTVAAFWIDKVINSINSDKEVVTIEIGDGEKYKNLTTTKLIWRRLIEKKFTRKSLVIALGGGVIGDVAGFAASTFMRGIDFAQVPTTLLAQVDAGIGGKTGINFVGKNMVGTFYQPKFILADTQFLGTLPDSEFLNGLSEVIKYGIILDQHFFQFLEENVEKVKAKDQKVLQEIVERCIIMKVRVVEEDEREGDLRRILNFGHTFGHAIEKLTNYKIKHGYAVSIGMMMACRIAEEMIGFNQTRCVGELLRRFGLPVSTRVDVRKIIKETTKDKKAWYGRTVVVLPEKIGKVIVSEVEQKELLRILRS